MGGERGSALRPCFRKAMLARDMSVWGGLQQPLVSLGPRRRSSSVILRLFGSRALVLVSPGSLCKTPGLSNRRLDENRP